MTMALAPTVSTCRDIVDSEGFPDNDSERSPSRHFVGFLATGYFHPRVANTALSCNEQAGNPLRPSRTSAVAASPSTWASSFAAAM